MESTVERHSWMTLAAALILVIGSPRAITAQQQQPEGRVFGKATNERGEVMADVEVEVVDAHRKTRTSRNGLYHLDSIPAGAHVFQARRVGFSPLVASIEVDSGETTYADVVMRPAANVLASVLVKADLLMRGVPRAFLERMHSGAQGTYITAADIKKQNPHRVSDILKFVPGVKVAENGEVFSSRGMVTVLSNGCSNGLPVYLDNVQVGGGTGGGPDGFIGDQNAGRVGRGPAPVGTTAVARSVADIVPPERVVAIEVYSGPATVPPTLPAANSACGAVFIWTR
ncbi:MAG: TonB-dependent receptor [Gemmatimonadota bacterium]|nr:TonB-dependent receptor [Gemmatimonadota bacterium]